MGSREGTLSVLAVRPSILKPVAAPIKFSFTDCKGSQDRGVDATFGTCVDAHQGNEGQYSTSGKSSDLGFSGAEFRYGIYNSADEPFTIPLSTKITRRVTFDPPFQSTPIVIIWFTGIDIRSQKLCRARVKVNTMCWKNFEFTIDTNEEAALYSVGISWLAY